MGLSGEIGIKLNDLGNLFKKCPYEPRTDLEKKWFILGFFTAVWVALIVLMPEFFIVSIFRDIMTPGILGGLITLVLLVPWPLFCLWKVRQIVNFSTNLAISMNESEERREERKEAEKQCLENKKIQDQ